MTSYYSNGSRHGNTVPHLTGGAVRQYFSSMQHLSREVTPSSPLNMALQQGNELGLTKSHLALIVKYFTETRVAVIGTRVTRSAVLEMDIPRAV